jgi:hypothetical protein
MLILYLLDPGCSKVACEKGPERVGIRGDATPARDTDTGTCDHLERAWLLIESHSDSHTNLAQPGDDTLMPQARRDQTEER